jgi:hypothetical protein
MKCLSLGHKTKGNFSNVYCYINVYRYITHFNIFYMTTYIYNQKNDKRLV